MLRQALVLDANILIRAVLGKKVRNFLIQFADSVSFFVPDICWQDAEKYLPMLFAKRHLSAESALELLVHLKGLLQIVDHTIYHEHEIEAKKRIQQRDIDDWQVIATALLFDCPIWTEDKDFFGSGIPTWTTDRISVFFEKH